MATLGGFCTYVQQRPVGVTAEMLVCSRKALLDGTVGVPPLEGESRGVRKDQSCPVFLPNKEAGFSRIELEPRDGLEDS